MIKQFFLLLIGAFTIAPTLLCGGEMPSYILGKQREKLILLKSRRDLVTILGQTSFPVWNSVQADRYFEHASFFLASGDFFLAEEELRHYLEFTQARDEPKLSQARLWLAVLFEIKGDIQQSAKFLASAIIHELPIPQENYDHLVNALQHLGQLQGKASLSTLAALALSPDAREDLLYFQSREVALHGFPFSQTLLRERSQVIQARSLKARLSYFLGIIALEKRNLISAEQSFKAAVKEVSSDDTLFLSALAFASALLKEEQGDLKGALSSLENVELISANYGAARFKIVQLLCRLQDYAKALDVAIDFIDYQPTSEYRVKLIQLLPQLRILSGQLDEGAKTIQIMRQEQQSLLMSVRDRLRSLDRVLSQDSLEFMERMTSQGYSPPAAFIAIQDMSKRFTRLRLREEKNTRDLYHLAKYVREKSFSKINDLQKLCLEQNLAFWQDFISLVHDAGKSQAMILRDDLLPEQRIEVQRILQQLKSMSEKFHVLSLAKETPQSLVKLDRVMKSMLADMQTLSWVVVQKSQSFPRYQEISAEFRNLREGLYEPASALFLTLAKEEFWSEKLLLENLENTNAVIESLMSILSTEKKSPSSRILAGEMTDLGVLIDSLRTVLTGDLIQIFQNQEKIGMSFLVRLEKGLQAAQQNQQRLQKVSKEFELMAQHLYHQGLLSYQENIQERLTLLSLDAASLEEHHASQNEKQKSALSREFNAKKQALKTIYRYWGKESHAQEL